MLAVLRVLFGAAVIAALLPAADFAQKRLSAEILMDVSSTEKGLEKLATIKRALKLAPQNYVFQQRRITQEARLGRSFSQRLAIEQAIRMRPSWPWSWQALANSLASQKEFSPAFHDALVRAHQLGGSSNDLVWKRFMLALEVLGEPLPKGASELLTGEVVRVYKSNRGKALGYALIRKRASVLCRIPELHDYDPSLRSWCDKSRLITVMCIDDRYRTPKVQKNCDDAMRYWWQKLLKPFRLLPAHLMQEELSSDAG